MVSDASHDQRQPGKLGEFTAIDLWELTGTLLAPTAGDIAVSIEPPDLDAAIRYVSTVRPRPHLTGLIVIRSRSHDTEVRLELPMPLEGLFLSHNPGRGEPGLSVWSDVMKDAPGFRWITRERDGVLCWRVGLNDGDYWEGDGAKTPSLRGNWQRPFAVLSALARYPDWLRAKLDTSSCRVLHPTDKAGRSVHVSSWHQLRELHRIGGRGVPTPDDLLANPAAVRIAEAAEALRVEATRVDEFLLRDKIVCDYWYFLRAEVPVALLSVVLGSCWVEGELWSNRESIWARLDGEAAYDLGLARSVWEFLSGRNATMRLQYSLVKGIVGKNGRSQSAGKILNPVDALSRITGFQKFPSGDLNHVAVHRRQNHPSSLGFVCPVQTPESKSVGLALHRARSAAIEKGTGTIVQGNVTNPADALGYAASLIPFFQHNDGARNMMAAKNLCQALPLTSREPPLVKTTGEALVTDSARGLVKAGLIPDCLSDDELSLGRNLLVAYMPWHGYNSDDAIVVGRHVVEGGSLDYVDSESFTHDIPGGYVSDGRGIPENGRSLLPGDIVARFVPLDGKGRPVVVTYKALSPCVVRSTYWSLLDERLDGATTFEYIVEHRWPLGLGDKLMGRHGNKGVIGRIESAMPRLPRDPALGKFSGRPVDIILNPHGVISRMNLGQLLETQVAWLLARGVSASEFADTRAGALPGEPFRSHVDFRRLRSLLVSTGLDPHGKVPLLIPASDGYPAMTTRCPVLVGIQYVVRLCHIANSKAHARGRAPEYKYSVLTDQPVRGKSQGGGQKIGEMEMWGLAAHEAWENLREVISQKSRQGPDDVLFADYFRELLFAYGIQLDAQQDGAELQFSVAGDREIRERSHGEVTNRTPLRRQEAFRFGCLAKTCSYQLGNTPLLTERRGRVTLHDVLTCRGWRVSAFSPTGDRFCIRLVAGHAQPRAVATLAATPRAGTAADALLLDCVVDPGTVSVATFPAHLRSFTLHGRFAMRETEKAQYGEGNLPAAAMLDMFQTQDGERSVTDLSFTCPDHSSRPLAPFGAPREVLTGNKRSFYAPEIFGDLGAGANDHSGMRWGHLDLPVAVEHPLATLFPSIHKKQPFPKLTALPVLPLRYRLPLLAERSIPTPSILRDGYYPIRSCIYNWKHMVKHGKEREAVALLERRVAELARCLRRLLPVGGKDGAVRSVGFGKRVDFSARMVIVPAPSLEWGEVGVPLAAFIELFRDDLADWAQSRSYSVPGRSLQEAFRAWRWKRDRNNVSDLEHLLEPCRDFLLQRPEITLILNRQPSLHKYSLQAFRPVIQDDLHAHVIRVSPLVCAAFGADFDGDEMALHRPLSRTALREASERMTPRHNFLSLSNGDPLCNFDQDFVLGSFFLYQPDLGYRKQLLDLLPQELHDQVPSGTCYGKKEGTALIKALCQAFPDQAESVIAQWARLAYRACTEMGVTFSFTELQDVARGIQKEEGDVLSPKEPAVRHLQGILAGECGQTHPGYHFAAMSQSGARGGDKQIPQILLARGHLSPGSLPYDMSVDCMTFHKSLLDGLDLPAFWRTSLNARSSMCDKNLGTAGAGYLTRRLVFACGGVTISADCQNGSRNGVLGCQVPDGVCAACFGELPDGRPAPLGFPIGLVMAQAVGERGTQLSMQSFHTGHRAVSIADFEALLEDNAYLFECVQRECKEISILRRQDCEQLPLDGTGNPVCPDHGVCMYRIECESLFAPGSARHFVQAMAGLRAYEGLDRRYIELLWKALNVRGGGLSRALARIEGSGGQLGFERQLQHIAELATHDASVKVGHLLARLLFVPRAMPREETNGELEQ